MDSFEYLKASSIVPSGVIKYELEGLYGAAVLNDMADSLKMYHIYDQGSDFHADENSDYTPAKLRYKVCKSLIDKEVRFLFSKTPDFQVSPILRGGDEQTEAIKQAISTYQGLVDSVLEKNQISNKLVQAAKDCFISKRVALMYNINPMTGIQISFLPSLEFIYDVDPNNSDILTKIVAFYQMNDAKAKTDQRIYKKKYWMENGVCWYLEEVYDGLGVLQETISEPQATKFSFIPAWVIINDGLTGDLIGSSEVAQLTDKEAWYNKLASSDIDSVRSGMHPIRYTVDASPESTSNLKIAPNAFWDLASDPVTASDKTAQVGSIPTDTNYSTALTSTLDRIKNAMYEQVAVPNVSPEALKGVVSSGKTLKAIYWDLIVRCDEKMLVWRPALKFMIQCIIEGARLYPEVIPMYISDPLPNIEYSIKVENQYSLPENETEEKQTDLSEVAAQTMSKKSYMMKWRGLTSDEADEELRQIALERELLEDSFGGLPTEKDQTTEEQQMTEEGEQPPEES